MNINIGCNESKVSLNACVIIKFNVEVLLI